MRSSSLYAMLMLSKTSSPQKLFDYDCMTLYNIHPMYVYILYITYTLHRCLLWRAASRIDFSAERPVQTIHLVS